MDHGDSTQSMGPVVVVVVVLVLVVTVVVGAFVVVVGISTHVFAVADHPPVVLHVSIVEPALDNAYPEAHPVMVQTSV